MIVAKEFKYWGGDNKTSQGYYHEVDLAEFPELQEMATESLDKNELVFHFLSYIAIRRCYDQALKEGTITQEQHDQLLAPFSSERKFEKKVLAMQAETKKVISEKFKEPLDPRLER